MTLEYLKQYKRLYLASPYTHYTKGREQAFKDICKIAGDLHRAGLFFYSPIAHWHPIAVYGGLDPENGALYVEHNKREQDLCDALLIAKMPGWYESEGITGEWAHAWTRKQPVYYLDPETMRVAKSI